MGAIAVKWAGALISTAVVAMAAVCNLLVAAFTGRQTPVAVNVLAATGAGVAAVFSFVAHLHERTERRIELLAETMLSQLDELESRIGDRNTGFVDGYLLAHGSMADTPRVAGGSASVVPLSPRLAPRRDT